MNDNLYTAVWLLLHDQEFAEAHMRLDARLFPKGPLRYLAALALRYWVEYRQPMTDVSLGRAMYKDASGLRRHGADIDSVAEVYIDLDAAYFVADTDAALARERVSEYLETTWMHQAVAAAQGALEDGDTEAAHSYLDAVRGALAEPEDEEIVLEEEVDGLLGRPVQDWESAVPTGLDELDNLWAGGIHPGELGIVLGPTNVGKSMVLCSFAAEAWWHQKDVLYYSFELTPEQISRRIASGIVRQGQLSTEGKNWDELVERAMKDRHWRGEPPGSSTIVRAGTLGVRELMLKLEKYESDFGKMPDLLILDSADDLLGVGQHRADWERLKIMYTELRRDICQGMGVALWTSGQATREAVDRARISLRHAGDAFAKYQRAHLCLGLTQTAPEAEEQDDPFGGALMHVYVLKDTLHGTPRMHMSCRVQWGKGQDGWPQATVEEVFNAPTALPRRQK